MEDITSYYDFTCEDCSRNSTITLKEKSYTYRVSVCECSSKEIKELQAKIEAYERISEAQDKEIIRLEEQILESEQMISAMGRDIINLSNHS